MVSKTNLFHLSLLLLFFIIQVRNESVPPNCLVRDDFLFHWSITKDEVYIFQIATPTKFKGWSAIGWSSTNTTEDSHMFIAHKNNSNLILTQVEDHFHIRNPEEVDFKNFKELDSLLPSKFVYYQFEIDDWNMPDNEFIFFAYNDEQNPYSLTNFTKHNYLKILKIKLSEHGEIIFYFFLTIF